MKNTLLSLFLFLAIATTASGGNTPLEIGDLTRANLDRTGTQKRPTAATMADGTILVAWERHEDSICDENQSLAIYLRRIAPGSPASSETRIDDITQGNHSIRIATGPAGNAAIAWERDANDDLPDGIYLRFLPSPASSLSSQFELTTSRDDIGDLTVLPNGKTLITFENQFALFNSPTEARIAPIATGVRDSRIIPLPDSSWIILWEQSSGSLFSRNQITGRHFSAEGTPGSTIPPIDAGERLDVFDTVTLADGTHRIVWTGKGPQVPGALNPTPQPTFIASRTVTADGSTITDATQFTRIIRRFPPRRIALQPIPSGGYLAITDEDFIRFDPADQPIGNFLPCLPQADLSISRPAPYTTQDGRTFIAHTANGPNGVDDADIFLTEIDITPQVPRPYGSAETLATGNVSLPFTATLTNGNTATIWREGTHKIIYSEAGETMTAIDLDEPLTPIGIYPENGGDAAILYYSGTSLHLAHKGFSGSYFAREIGTGIPAGVATSLTIAPQNNTGLTLLQNDDIVLARLPFSNAGLFTVLEAANFSTPVRFEGAAAARSRSNLFGLFYIAIGYTDTAGNFTIRSQLTNTNLGEAVENEEILLREEDTFIRDFALDTNSKNGLILITSEDSLINTITLHRFGGDTQPLGIPSTIESSRTAKFRNLAIAQHDAGFLLTYSRSDADTTIVHVLLDQSGLPITGQPLPSSTALTGTPLSPHTALSSFGNGRTVWATAPEFGISQIQSRPIFGPGAENDSRFAAFTGAACIPNDPEGDPDGDGYNNTAEFVTGSHPNDRSSIPDPIKIVSQGNGFRIDSPLRSGIDRPTHQSFQSSEDLIIWNGTDSSLGVVTSPVSPRSFYRFSYNLTPEDQ